MKWVVVRTPRRHLHEVLLLGLLAARRGLGRQRGPFLGLLALPPFVFRLLLFQLGGFSRAFFMGAAFLRFGSSTGTQLLPHGVRQRLAEPPFIISTCAGHFCQIGPNGPEIDILSGDDS